MVPALSCRAANTAGTTSITAGKARFEFLTASLVRMEFSPSERFVDAPTAVVQKRDWPSVKVEQREQSGWLIAASTDLTLRYRLGSGAFTAENLTITWNDRGAAHSW
ncbi:MAG TPA: hypothetical protein VNH41_11690, partial [Steroidobacteraceae bacterium]|nr:hypothetical protein [Steroidobacteraceae bacterium]